VDRMRAKDALECMGQCDDDFSCSAWTYMKSKSICRLKGAESLGQLVLKKGYVSGAAQCNTEDVDLAASLLLEEQNKHAAPKPPAPRSAQEIAAAKAKSEEEAAAATAGLLEAAAAAREAALAAQAKEAAAAAAAAAEAAEEAEEAAEEAAMEAEEEAAMQAAMAAAEAEGSLPWANTPDTTRMWQLIHGGDVEGLEDWIEAMPHIVHIRSEDGRGPLWWAYEYARYDFVEVLLQSGVDPLLEDVTGMKPAEM